MKRKSKRIVLGEGVIKDLFFGRVFIDMNPDNSIEMNRTFYWIKNIPVGNFKIYLEPVKARKKCGR